MFARVEVISVLDLYLLPPVKAKQIFVTPSNPYIAIYDTWRRFRFSEITQAMRQRDEVTLSLLRARIGEEASDDINSSKEKTMDCHKNPFICFRPLMQKDTTIMLEKLPGEIIEIKRQDTPLKQVEKRHFSPVMSTRRDF